MTPVPEPKVPKESGVTGLYETIRVVNQNFRQVRDLIERAIANGTLIADGSIVSSMLSTNARTLVGDVTGLTGVAADGGTTTVEKLRGKSLAAPVAGDDAKAIVYAHGSTSFGYADVLRDVLTTRGDLVRRGAAAEERFAVGAANTVLMSDGTDPAWGTVTALLDALFSSSQGAILYRDAAAWAALAPGTSGHFLKTQGAAANPLWAAPAGGLTSPLTTKGDIWAYDSADNRFPVGAAADGTVLTRDAASAFGFKWAAAGGSNALLDGSVHTDTLAGTVVRGDLIIGNSTPKWARVALGASGKVVRSNGTDASWQFDRRLAANKSSPIRVTFGAATNTSSGIHAAATAGGSVAAAGDALRVANKYTQSTANGRAGINCPSSSALITPAMSPAFWTDFRLNTFVLCYLQVGFSTNGIQGTAAKVTTVHGAFLAFLAGTDTNFFFRTCDTSAANAVDTGVAKDTNWHDVLIYTRDAGTTWVCELDGVQVASSATNVPLTTQVLICHTGFTAGSGGTQNGDMSLSYMVVQTNDSL